MTHDSARDACTFIIGILSMETISENNLTIVITQDNVNYFFFCWGLHHQRYVNKIKEYTSVLFVVLFCFVFMEKKEPQQEIECLKLNKTDS